MMREILDILCQKSLVDTVPELRDDIDQALAQLKSEILGKLPKEKFTKKNNSNCHSAPMYNAGFNNCLTQIKKIVEEG
jgi:hypothetical protein